jgi:hypothetical protein
LQKLVGWFKEGADRILEMRAASIQLGASFEETAGLAMAAGGEVERMTKLMTHLNSTIQSARTGDTGALSLLSGRLKLDAEALARMSNTKRLETVMQALTGVQDELTKTNVELGIFGERTALAFGGLLKSGKDLEIFRAQARRFGLDLGATAPGEGRALADQALAAKRALGDMDLAIAGIKMNIAAGLSPVIVALAEQFSAVGVNAKLVQEITFNLAKTTAIGAAYAVDAWNGLVTALYKVVNVLQVINVKMLELTQFMGDDVPDRFRKALKEAHALKQKILAREAAPGAVAGVQGFFDNLMKRMEENRKAAEKAEEHGYAPMQVPVRLAGAAQYGSQEAYKTLGEFAAGESASIAAKQLDQQKVIAEQVKKLNITEADIRRQIKEGMVRNRKI